jgi:hypothetical protein
MITLLTLLGAKNFPPGNLGVPFAASSTISPLKTPVSLLDRLTGLARLITPFERGCGRAQQHCEEAKQGWFLTKNKKLPPVKLTSRHRLLEHGEGS